MDNMIESLLLSARWLLLPLYLGLLATVVAIYAMVGRELWHLVQHLADIDEHALVVLLLSVLDLVLIANLIVMVGISSYESFISRIDGGQEGNKPEWLGKLDSGNVKLKVALSVVMISAIHLLRAYMMDTETPRLIVLAGVHLVFVASGVMMTVMDRMQRAGH